MKLVFCCVAATLMVSSSLAAIDVEKTVRQVQSILSANSHLPRLSRDEIIQLLNDIRAEDAKSASREQSKEITATTPYSIDSENEITRARKPNVVVNNVKNNENDAALSASAPTRATVESTTKTHPTVMVVHAYTPREGVSLQELYTKPPRVEVVPEVKVTPKPIHERLKTNAKIANSKKQEIPDELLAFLNAHGLKANPSTDNFLLPLQGFKPLPPATVVDGSIQLPENILLAYDLISPNAKQSETVQMSPQNYLFEPLHPDYQFELDSSSSESKKTVLPLDLPKSRKTKSTVNPPNFETIDYDAVKVIPLQAGPNPTEGITTALHDQSKRQTNSSEDATTTVATETTTAMSVETDAKDSAGADSAAAADTDSGASIADLEESFGGAAPAQPGDSQLPPPRKNGFYWMVDWNSFLEVGDGDTKVNIRFEPKLGDPQMFLPVNVP